MKILAVFLIFTIATVIAQEQKNGVYQLTQSNFEDFIKSHNNVLVKFYAPWCQHSQKLAPEFEKAAASLSSSNIILAEVDCTKETNLAQGLMIDNYPTLLYFLKQKLIEYNGGKTKDEIESWVNSFIQKCKKKLIPPVTWIKSSEELQEYQKKKSNVIVLYFGEQNAEAYQEFEETVHLFNNDDLKFLATANLMNKFEIKDIPSIILLKQFDENRIDFTQAINSVELKQFITLNMFPRIVQLSDKTAEHIFGDNHPVMFLYLNNATSLTEIESNILKMFHSSAEEINRKIMMSECYQTSEVCLRIAEFTGISSLSTPLLQILDPRGPIIKKYILQGEITKDTIKEFVNSFEAGSLKPYYKSQDVPKDDTKNKIKTIVGKTFIEEVIKKQQNIVVNFYAEWCTKSQQFKPIYEKLAEMMTEESNLLFTQIEASENEVPDIEIDFFPTVILYTSENKSKPIEFKGEKQLDQLIEFINQSIQQQEKLEKTEEKTDL